MRRVTLLYNPVSGRDRNRTRTVERIAAALRAKSIQVTIIPTDGPNRAGNQASSIDTDILFACGGDGTVHEILQGLVFIRQQHLALSRWAAQMHSLGT